MTQFRTTATFCQKVEDERPLADGMKMIFALSKRVKLLQKENHNYGVSNHNELLDFFFLVHRNMQINFLL